MTGVQTCALPICADRAAAVAAARSWFRRAARAHQDSALPFMLYYDSFTALGQTPPPDAVNGLYHAVVLVPQDTQLRVRAALSLIREGQVSRARSVIAPRSEEHTSELQSLITISYSVFCLDRKSVV